MSIQAIETEYKGYKFRSRLEARWSVFFDAMNVKWEYEPEGFENDKGERYLPDFYLHGYDVWCEVKPNDYSKHRDIERACSFVTKDLKIRALVLLPGIPDPVYDNSLFWYRCAYYNTLAQRTEIARVVLDYAKYSDTENKKFFVVQNLYIGKHHDIVYPNNIKNWDCVHDRDIPYGEGLDEFICRWSDGRKTPELDNAYKKARQARFGNIKNFQR